MHSEALQGSIENNVECNVYQFCMVEDTLYELDVEKVSYNILNLIKGHLIIQNGSF